MSVLITPAELEPLIGTVRVLDVRYRLDAPDGRAPYLEGHVPTAVYVSLDDELSRHGEPAEGRHPLPDTESLQAAARRWGLRTGDTVVVYDDWRSIAAARAWWLLTDAGVADVRILDGGLRAWRAAGLPLEPGDVTPEPGDVILSSGALARLDIDEAAAFPERGVLLDVRAPERYRGESEPLDPVAGHIPGARNAPGPENTDAEGRFLDADALRERFASLGIAVDTPVGVYCGSGLTAAHATVALRIAGVDAALYPGSWSQWANTPGRPAATGPTP
ncbi:sulfurtransferase [Microbacterium sp. No. 7]|uniref:sulfurtransferase n=1 Tax=Microbacterium sp. No. 7 TaxID=1714373 RepID=UPI0006D0F5F2|nr:sulfurtransferase [Microbacterium sp. No. 7]ALJ21633.1 thiosulfate sulfurtransferase [Microbacterium sp. No. 7]